MSFLGHVQVELISIQMGKTKQTTDLMSKNKWNTHLEEMVFVGQQFQLNYRPFNPGFTEGKMTAMPYTNVQR